MADVFALDITRGKGKEGCSQRFRLQSEKSNFGKDLAIYIKMIPLLENYHMEIKALVQKGMCERTFIAILLRMTGN